MCLCACVRVVDKITRSFKKEAISSVSTITMGGTCGRLFSDWLKLISLIKLKTMCLDKLSLSIFTDFQLMEAGRIKLKCKFWCCSDYKLKKITSFTHFKRKFKDVYVCKKNRY